MSRKPGSLLMNAYGYPSVGANKVGHTHVKPRTRVLVKLFDGRAFIDKFLRVEGKFHYFESTGRVKSSTVLQLSILTKAHQYERGFTMQDRFTIVSVDGVDTTPAEHLPALSFAEYLKLFPVRTPWARYGKRDSALIVIRQQQERHADALRHLLKNAPAPRLLRSYGSLETDFVSYQESGLADRHIRYVEAKGEGLPDRHLAMRDFAWLHLAQSVIPYWRAIVSDTPADPAMINAFQFTHAMDGMMMMEARGKNWGNYYGPDSQTEHAQSFRWFQGTSLAEYDLMIVLTELAKTRPWLTILAAPARFTRGQNGAAILLLDREREEIVAARVHADDGEFDYAELGEAQYDRRSSETVVVVDSALDLGNITRLDPFGEESDGAARAWPGLIAARRVLDHKKYGKEAQHWHRPPQMLQYVRDARKMLSDVPDNLSTVNEIVREKVLGRFSPDSPIMMQEPIA